MPPPSALWIPGAGASAPGLWVRGSGPSRGPWSRSHMWLSACLSKASHSHVKRNHPHGSADSVALSISGSCWPPPFSSTVMLALVTPPHLHASRLPAVPGDCPSTSQWNCRMSVSGSHPKSLQWNREPVPHVRSTVQSTYLGFSPY